MHPVGPKCTKCKTSASFALFPLTSFSRAMQAVHAIVAATCISVVIMTGYYIYTDKQTRLNEVSFLRTSSSSSSFTIP